MSYKEYQKLLTRAKNKMSPYLNSLGLFYDKDIQKFIGFNDYEVLLIEFEEFLQGKARKFILNNFIRNYKSNFVIYGPTPQKGVWFPNHTQINLGKINMGRSSRKIILELGRKMGKVVDLLEQEVPKEVAKMSINGFVWIGIVL